MKGNIFENPGSQDNQGEKKKGDSQDTEKGSGVTQEELNNVFGEPRPRNNGGNGEGSNREESKLDPGEKRKKVIIENEDPIPKGSKENIDAFWEGDIETDEKPGDFYGVDKKEIAKIFLSYLGDDKKKDLLNKIGKKGLKGICPVVYLEEKDWRNFANEIIDRIPEAKKEAAETEIKDLLLFSEDLETEEIGAEEPEDESLKQILEKINKKVSAIRDFQRSNDFHTEDLENINAVIESAINFKEVKEQELKDVPFEAYEEEMKELNSAIDGLERMRDALEKIKAKQEKQEKKPETAGSFVEELRKKTKEFGKTINDSTEALKDLREACDAEGLSDEEKGKYEKLIEEETEKRTYAGIGLAWTGGAVATEGALGGMEKIIAKEKGGLSVEDSEELRNLSEALLAGISSILEGVEMERKLMQPEEVKILEKLEKGAEEEIQRPDESMPEEGEEDSEEEKEGGSNKNTITAIDGSEMLIGKNSEELTDDKTGEDRKEQDEITEEKNVSIESSNYHRLINFFRAETGKQETRSEAASLLINAEKRPLADKIMALKNNAYEIEKKIEMNENGKSETGTIVMTLKDPNNYQWDKKLTIKVIFTDYEDSGILSPLRRAFTSREKNIKISASMEDINAMQEGAIAEETIKNPQVFPQEKMGEALFGMPEDFNNIVIPEIGVGNPSVLRAEQEGTGAEKPHGDSTGQEIATETTSENKKIEDMTLSEIDKSSGPAVFEARLSPHNSFAVSVGIGGSSFSWEGAEGRMGLGKVEKILFFKEHNKTGESVDSLERSNMKPGVYVIIETDHKGAYYELFMQDEQKVVLRKMEAPSHVILSPEENFNKSFGAKVASFWDGIIGSNSNKEPGGKPTPTA